MTKRIITIRKMRNYLRKKACLHMHLPDVISQENQ